jgi:hypothetical protein
MMEKSDLKIGMHVVAMKENGWIRPGDVLLIVERENSWPKSDFVAVLKKVERGYIMQRYTMAMLKDLRPQHMDYNQVRELLSEKEHEQWMAWSKRLADDLGEIREFIEKNAINNALHLIHRRITNWDVNWKPYSELTEDTKDSDREWADKILDSIPVRCPVYQCGGFMRMQERDPPKGWLKDQVDGWDGDEQTPDMVCENCGAHYQFKGFKD